MGVFDYDLMEFEIKKFDDGTECLHYCGNGKSVDLPDGCINTSWMFSHRKLPEGFFSGGYFDTSKVTNMEGMFSQCILPEDFSLGKHFNTSSVTDMKFMFDNCKYNGIDAYDYFETESDIEIINKLREH